MKLKDFVDGYFGVWRTMGGRRVFIRDGEDLPSAMERSRKFKPEEQKLRKLLYNEYPKISYDADYDKDIHANEIDQAEWLCNTFRTKVRCLKESSIEGKRVPDYLLNDKYYCEFKKSSSRRSIESQIRSSIGQFISVGATSGNAILLLYIKGNMKLEEAVKCTLHYGNMHFRFPVFVIIRDDDDFDVIIVGGNK